MTEKPPENLPLPFPVDPIRDADLRAKVEAARGSPAFEAAKLFYASVQKERDEAAASDRAKVDRLAKLPRDAKRRAEIREVIENSPTSAENLRYMHSVMAMCPFPYRRWEGPVYEKGQGRMSMVVEAGSLRMPDGTRVQQEVPWGPKARLIMAYLTTEALQQKSPRVEIADSLRAFMLECGFEPRGGARGNIKPFKDQLMAISAARVEVSSWDGQKADTIEENLFRHRQVWFDAVNIDQQSLWPSFVEWNSQIFQTLQKHAMPLDMRALKAFRNSSRKLDIYAWLAYRVHNMRYDVTLTWDAVRRQFGEGFERPRAFREWFLKDLDAVKEVFPKVPLIVTEQGLTLEKVDAGALMIPKRKLLPKG